MNSHACVTSEFTRELSLVSATSDNRFSLSACARRAGLIQFLPAALCADPANRCLADDIHMVASDGGQFVLNSGVMLLRNHPWTCELLRVSACRTHDERSLRG